MVPKNRQRSWEQNWLRAYSQRRSRAQAGSQEGGWTRGLGRGVTSAWFGRGLWGAGELRSANHTKEYVLHKATEPHFFTSFGGEGHVQQGRQTFSACWEQFSRKTEQLLEWASPELSWEPRPEGHCHRLATGNPICASVCALAVHYIWIAHRSSLLWLLLHLKTKSSTHCLKIMKIPSYSWLIHGSKLPSNFSNLIGKNIQLSFKYWMPIFTFS